MEEQKRYRNSFIFLTLIATAGILVGLYLYEYTDYFSAIRQDTAVATADLDIKELILIFFDEFKLMAVIFLCGFTLFSAYVSALLVVYKGFMTGFSVLYFGLCYSNGSINKIHFILTASALTVLLLIYIITGAKAVAFSGSLRYAAPDVGSLLHRKSTSAYMITFLILSSFALMALTLKYVLPIVKI